MSCNSSKHLSPKAAYEYMKTKNDYILLDLSKSFKFKDGHIEGAVSVEFLPEYFEKRISKIKRDKIVIIYCGTGKKTEKAKKVMEDMGFERLYIIDGGLRAWKKSGFKIVK
jgi:rhodanese-related sulfurtransferase